MEQSRPDEVTGPDDNEASSSILLDVSSQTVDEPDADRPPCFGHVRTMYGEGAGDQAAAKAICATCNRAAACLDEALARDERFGVWGGLTAEERRALARTEAA